MKIAILSGKGGAGKTFVSVNLAFAGRRHFGNVSYIDCDVEEPNAHLFFSAPVSETETVFASVPSFDREKCTGCRKCVDFCKFNALVFIKKSPVLFSEMCHGCGACEFLCPSSAIGEQKRPIGIIETRKFQNITLYSGILNTGEANGIKIIQSSLKKTDSPLTVIDCPPGSACSVTESIQDADFCVLIAEPTSFGFHNFQMIYELTSLLNKKSAVLINKEEEKYAPLYNFCEKKQLPVIGAIPFDKKLAKSIADGTIISMQDKNVLGTFDKIFTNITELL